MSRIPTINPATAEKISSYALMDEGEAIAAVDACHAAFQDWRRLSHTQRGPT